MVGVLHCCHQKPNPLTHILIHRQFSSPFFGVPCTCRGLQSSRSLWWHVSWPGVNTSELTYKTHLQIFLLVFVKQLDRRRTLFAGAISSGLKTEVNYFTDFLRAVYVTCVLQLYRSCIYVHLMMMMIIVVWGAGRCLHPTEKNQVMHVTAITMLHWYCIKLLDSVCRSLLLLRSFHVKESNIFLIIKKPLQHAQGQFYAKHLISKHVT